MKLTFRDLKQQKFVIEAEPSEKILDVKGKIAMEKGWPPSQQKLIYSGKILQDANTVESYNIEEKGFIVCMVSKPKAPSASAASSSQTPAIPPSAPTPATPSAPTRANVTASETPATPSPAGGAGSGATFNDPSALLMGNQGQEAIAQMEAMGFSRSNIDRAMRAAYFNPDRAIEYLLNGIPDEPERPAANAPAASRATQPPAAGGASESQVQESLNLFEQAAAQASGGGTGRGRGAGTGTGAGAGAGEGAGSLGSLEFLRNNPHFQQLRQLVQQQPQMLEPILQQVGAGNPQLAQLIGQNQEQFLQLLSEDIDDETQLPPGAQSISVTEEERDAIERLCRLGFSRDSVIQAYFACDKNEELAANFLFDQPDEGEDQQ
ncbi:UV excision repair protein rad23 [Microsporum ferrugineum]